MDTNKHELKESEPILLRDEVYQIAGCAMTVLNTLGHGFSEKVYENALAVEMGLQKILFQQQSGFDVFYKEINVGKYIPDFIIDDKIIVEMKTIDRITDAEKGQMLNYLKVTNLKVGLIFNFKHSKLEWQRMVL